MTINDIKRYLTIFELNGKIIMGIYSLAIIALSCYTCIIGSDLPSGVVTAYGIVISAFALHKAVTKIKGVKNVGKS